MSTAKIDFHTQYKEIMKNSLGTDSIFEGAVSKLTAKYDSLGITAEEQAKLITSTISQMAVAISASSMNTALELVLRDTKTDSEVALIDAQKLAVDEEAALSTEKKALVIKQEATETNKALLVTRQEESFDDKNRQEAMKSMAGIAQMMGTTGVIDDTGTVYTHHKTTVNNVLGQTNTALA